MSIEETWGGFFKPEARTSGAKLFAQEKVSVPSGSDTQIQAYVRQAPPSKVQLRTDDIGSPTFTAECSCPLGKKGQFCKHVWATLLMVDEKYPDFLSAKQSIEKPGSEAAVAAPEPTEKERERAQAQAERKESMKERAAAYRKEQYERQKLRAKELKHGKKARESAVAARSNYPEEVEAALRYFTDNGFPMELGPDEAILGEAKRKLSRVFHPDKGGSHEEVQELNRNAEAVQRFLRGF